MLNEAVNKVHRPESGDEILNKLQVVQVASTWNREIWFLFAGETIPFSGLQISAAAITLFFLSFFWRVSVSASVLVTYISFLFLSFRLFKDGNISRK